jgi:hypothetical protein
MNPVALRNFPMPTIVQYEYDWFIGGININAYVHRASEINYVAWLKEHGFDALAMGWEEILKADRAPRYSPEAHTSKYAFFHKFSNKKPENCVVTNFVSHWAYKYMGLDTGISIYFEAMQKLAIAWCLDNLHDMPKLPEELK